MKPNAKVGVPLSWLALAAFILIVLFYRDSEGYSQFYLATLALAGHFVGLALRIGRFGPVIWYFAGIIGSAILMAVVIAIQIVSGLTATMNGQVSDPVGGFFGFIGFLVYAIVLFAAVAITLIIIPNVKVARIEKRLRQAHSPQQL